MRFRIHLTNPAIFAMLWVALSALVLHDIMLRHASMQALRYGANTNVTERVVTKEFVLVDDNGNTRARIGMNDKTHAPSVQLFDSAGNQRAQLRLNKDDVPSLRLYDASGSLKSVMGFTLADMQPAYITFDNNGTGHIENTSRPNNFQSVYDEDLMTQRLSFLSPFNRASSRSVNQRAYMTFTAASQVQAANAQVEAAVQAAQADADARAQLLIQAERARTEAEDARAQINALSRDPFRAGK